MNTSLQNTESYRQVLAWLRGGDVTPDVQMEDRLLRLLNEAVIQCVVNSRDEIRRLCTAADRRERRMARQPSPLSIKAVMAQCGVEYRPGMFGSCSSPGYLPSDADDIGDLPEGDPVVTVHPVRYDSLDFAKALAHMALIEGRGLNMSQIQAILYIAYGVWMVHHDGRLFEEHPQAWQYGPVFPRVYSKMRKGVTDSQERYLKLKEDSPERLAFLERCFRRYAWTSACDLAAPHKSKGTPWHQTRKENPESQTARIPDSLVKEWFTERVNPELH